jgi:hypothetical protein
MLVPSARVCCGQILPFDCDRGECARSVASDLDVWVTDYQEQPALDASSARRAAPGLEDLSQHLDDGTL